MRARVLGAGLAAAALLATAVRALETADTYRASMGAFLAGRLEEAAAGYKYLVTLGVDGAKPTASLAVLAREEGRADEAVAHWVRATLLDGYDASLWNERGWGHLAIGRVKEAREAFGKAVEVSSAPYLTAEAGFGLGLAEQLDGNAKASIAAYQTAFVRSAYLLPAVAVQLGRLAVRLKKWPTAETYYRQALEQDPYQSDVALELARVLEKEGQLKGAWQAYKHVLDLDPAQEGAKGAMDRVAKSIRESPERFLTVRRLTRPLVQKPQLAPPSKPLRVVLYSDGAGEPSSATKFYFLSGADFKVMDVRLGEVTSGRSLDQWEASFREDTRVIELRDAQRNLKFTTKQGFRIEPVKPGFTVLIKSAELVNLKGVDIGDREVRGLLEVAPTPHGFGLVNEVALEDYVSGVVGDAMPSAAPREALRAQAVIARTKAAAVPSGQHHPFFSADLCDSSHCQVYSGIVRESEKGREAVLSTAGGRLVQKGAPVLVGYHQSCGWATEERGEDAERPLGFMSSSWALDQLVRSSPPAHLYCETSAMVPPSWNRWVRVLEGDALRARIERLRFIGRLHDVRIVERTATGRVTALDVVGSRETLRIKGSSAIEAFLAPRSLRSTLFTLQPLYDGKVLNALIVWGAGSGDGRGLCVAGAMGMAHLKRKYREILAHYFPGADVRGAPEDPPEPGAAGARPGKGGVTAKEQARARAKRAARLRQRQKTRARRGEVPAVSTAPAASEPPPGAAAQAAEPAPEEPPR